jgi:hypothetical protein
MTDDARLLELGAEFDAIAQEIEATIGESDELSDEAFHHSDALHLKIQPIADAICRTPATTFKGLRVKARVARWLGAGDDGELVEDDVERDCLIEMAESILRDLLAA